MLSCQELERRQAEEARRREVEAAVEAATRREAAEVAQRAEQREAALHVAELEIEREFAARRQAETAAWHEAARQDAEEAAQAQARRADVGPGEAPSCAPAAAPAQAASTVKTRLLGARQRDERLSSAAWTSSPPRSPAAGLPEPKDAALCRGPSSLQKLHAQLEDMSHAVARRTQSSRRLDGAPAAAKARSSHGSSAHRPQPRGGSPSVLQWQGTTSHRDQSKWGLQKRT